MTTPRVMLVEDDASLRRFVRMALEDLPLELVECDGVPSAMAALGVKPVQLILTDLMMPGESGIDLIDRLQQAPDLLGNAKIIVLSAGLTPDLRQQLDKRKVWRLLDKPVSVVKLEASVLEALNEPPTEATPPSAATLGTSTNAAALAVKSAVETAITDYFEDDLALYHSYRALCYEQFPIDIVKGDAACSSDDLPALRLVSHSLKSVLQTLGHPEMGDMARAVEHRSHAGEGSAAKAGWTDLRIKLQQLIDAG